MNKILTTVLLLSSLFANAQFEKGDKFIGGYLRISSARSASNSNNQNGYSNTGIELQPSFGYFITNNLALGASVNYASNTYKNTYYSNGLPYSTKTTSNVIGTSVFAKKFFTINENFLFALEANIYYDHDVQKSASSKTKSYDLGTAIRPSFVFFPSKHWGLEASLGSLSYNYNHGQTSHTNGVYLSLGSFSLGFAYYLRK